MSPVAPACNPPRSWTPREVAEALSIDYRTVLKMAKRGSLPCVKLGNKVYRFDPALITALLADTTPKS